MDIRNRKIQAIGLAAVIIVIVLLVVFIPGSDNGGTPTPTPTSTPKPTFSPGGDSYEIYFTETDYQVSGAGQEFYTTINITPVELFYGAQFVLEWDCTLFELDGGWTQSNGHGYLYNGTSPNPTWVKASEVALNPTGDNPQCPDPKQGRVNFMVTWDDYYGIAERGMGVDVNREGTLVTLRWRAHSGADYRTGTTDIRFTPKMKIVGYLIGAYEYTKPVHWHNTSVTLK